MSNHKSKRKNSKTDTPQVSMIYDTALPQSLKTVGLARQTKSKINLHTDRNQKISPYVIKLSHQTEIAKFDKETKLQELAKQLMLDEDFDFVTDSKQENNELSITQTEIIDQLREIETTPNPVKSLFKNSQALKIPITDEIPFSYQNQTSLKINIDDLIAKEYLNETPEAIDTDKKIVNTETEDETKEKDSILLGWISKIHFPTIKTCRLHILLPQQARHRAIASFLILSFILVLPIHAMQGLADTQKSQATITNTSLAAVKNLMSGISAVQANKLTVASSDFTRASQKFADAEDSLSNMHLVITALINIIPQTDRTYDSVSGLITAGKELSTTASLISDAMNEISQSSSINVITKLKILKSYIKEALPHVQTAQQNLEKVNIAIIPNDQKDKIQELLDTTPKLLNSMEEFLTFSDTVIMMLGDNQKMKYLVAFQNNTELRATGGFTGSFAEIDMLNGEIDNIRIPKGGTYDLQGQLSKFVFAPEPLQLLNPRWEFHDANWFPDFPSSAKKMLWFYENAGAPTTDGVITINATVIPKLLELTGPIEMPEYDRTINSENFLFETQKIVELEYNQYITDNNREENAPKQFIGDLAPKLLNSLQNTDIQTLLSVVDLIGSSLNNKDILLYFKENELQNKIEKLGWSGSIKQANSDYLMVVDTNLGGGKTDTVITQDIDVNVEIQENGDIINTITITKEHHGLANSFFEDNNNVDYLRLYVPEGSQLLDASGFEIPPDYLFETSDINLVQDKDLSLMMNNYNTDYATGTDIWEESGKTVFGNWMQTAPGETEKVKFVYKLPIALTAQNTNNNLFELAKSRIGIKDLNTYSLLIQKQPGVETRTTNITVHTADNIQPIWTSNEDIISTEGLSISNQFDEIFQMLLENK